MNFNNGLQIVFGRLISLGNYMQTATFSASFTNTIYSPVAMHYNETTTETDHFRYTERKLTGMTTFSKTTKKAEGSYICIGF